MTDVDDRDMESLPLNGIGISERFYEEYGKQMIAEKFPEYENLIAVGVAGEGSDCFGYDDAVSRDHDFEAGFCLFIPDVLAPDLEFKLSRAYAKLPDSFLGVIRAKHSIFGGNRRGVILTGDFYRRFLGRPDVPEDLMEWLSIPEYSLAAAVNGKIFRDDLGEFTGIREKLLKGYPEDVRLKKIAARAAMMAQSGQYNFSRCLSHGEPGAAMMALGEFTEQTLSMIFLLNRRYQPYYKWAFRAGKELPVLADIPGRLEQLTIRGLDDPAAIKAEIEAISSDIIVELRRQDLTRGDWDYLEPHAFEVMGQIRDGNVRNLHVMEG